MGAVADRCSDMNPAERHESFRKNSGGRAMAKALDEDSSEEEEDEDPDEGSDMAGSLAEEAEDMRAETELALIEGFTKNSAATFHEVIDHAKGLGIDPAKINKAEEMLKHHRAQQCRDLFEADMKVFLETADADNLDACKGRLDQGRGYGCSEKVLQPLRTRIADLELCVDLAADEVAKAKLFLELCTRSFVKSCVSGRETIWVDLKANRRMKAAMHLDVVLKNFTVKSSKGEQLATAKVADLDVKRALEVEHISRTEAFGKLPEKERQFGVVLVGHQVTWLIGESNRASQDEFLVGLAVLNRRGIEAKSNATSKTPSGGSGSICGDKEFAFAAKDGEEEASSRGKPKAMPKTAKTNRSATMHVQEEVAFSAKDGEEEATENNEPQDNEQEDIGFHEVEDNIAAAAWDSEEQLLKNANSHKELLEAVPAVVAAQEKGTKEKKEKKKKKEKKHKKESK